MWIGGFILAFIIPPRSYFYWIPDALLLLGFWPLLWEGNAKWLWLVFGVLNFFIGIVLQISAVLPDQYFKPDAVLSVKTHLQDYHSPLAWMAIGVFSVLVGLIRLVSTFSSWLFQRVKR